MVGEEYRWRAFERKDKMGSILACMGKMEMKTWKRRLVIQFNSCTIHTLKHTHFNI